jgi:uncharacterized membrane protein HdeD (DUF308 family)
MDGREHAKRLEHDLPAGEELTRIILEGGMLRLMARNWWLLVLRGVCAIMFGVLAWTWPGVTLHVLVLLFGAYALVDGVLAFAAAFSGSTNAPWWVLVIEGLAGVLAAGAAFFVPGITAVILLLVIAFRAIIGGVLEIAAAIRLRKEIEGEFWLALAGAGSILFGVVLLARPALGALAVIWMIGVYAVIFGGLLIALGFRVRALKGAALPA